MNCLGNIGTFSTGKFTHLALYFAFASNQEIVEIHSFFVALERKRQYEIFNLGECAFYLCTLPVLVTNIVIVWCVACSVQCCGRSWKKFHIGLAEGIELNVLKLSKNSCPPDGFLPYPRTMNSGS